MKQIYKKPEINIVSVRTEMPFAWSLGNGYNSGDVTYSRESDDALNDLLLFDED